MAFLAVISSITMPFGYMPAKAADGGFILRICDGTMPMKQEPMDHESMHHTGHAAGHMMASSMSDPGDMHAEHDDGMHESRCNYAVTFAADLPDAPEIAQTLEPNDALEPVRLAVLTAIFPPNLPPSTGPPAV